MRRSQRLSEPSESQGIEVFAALHLPEFALQAALHVRADALAAAWPAVLVEGEGRRSIVIACNAEARDYHIHAGMSTAKAVARLPNVCLVPRNEAAERLATNLLLVRAMSVAATVEETSPGTCIADLRGHKKEKSGLAGMLRAAVDELALSGLCGRVGLAATPDIALWASWTATVSKPLRIVDDHEEFLDNLPLDAVGLPAGMRDVLAGWGLETMGDFASFDRRDIADRLGPAGVRWWDAARAQDIRPLKVTGPPLDNEASFEWEEPVESLDPLLFVLRRLLDVLCGRLKVRAMGVRELLLVLKLEHRKDYQRRFSLPEITGNSAIIFRMLHTHLEQVRTEYAIVAVRIRVRPEICKARQAGIFDTLVANPWQFSETLARLAGIAGPGRVGCPRLESNHCPDGWNMDSLPLELKAWVDDPDTETATDAPFRAGLPLYRLRPAVRIRVEVSGGCPVGMESPFHSGGIRVIGGPWSVSVNWWDPKSSRARHEWDVQTQCGRLCRLAYEGQQWFLEGFYG